MTRYVAVTTRPPLPKQYLDHLDPIDIVTDPDVILQVGTGHGSAYWNRS